MGTIGGVGRGIVMMRMIGIIGRKNCIDDKNSKDSFDDETVMRELSIE